MLLISANDECKSEIDFDQASNQEQILRVMILLKWTRSTAIIHLVCNYNSVASMVYQYHN